MSVSVFLRKNLVAVIGVALPLLLVLLLVALRGITASRIPEPRHDLLIVSQSYGNTPVEFSVERGKLKIRYLPAKEGSGQLVRKAPELLYLDVDRLAVRPIIVELPVGQDGQLSDQTQTLELPELVGLTLSADSVAPDGYRFERAERSSGGLFGELFGGSYRSRYVLAKDGRRIKLPDTEDRYNVKLIGWVVGGELGE